MRLAFEIAVIGAVASGDAALAREPLQAVLLTTCRHAAEQPEPTQALASLTADLTDEDRKAVYEACVLYQSGYSDGLKTALQIKHEQQLSK